MSEPIPLCSSYQVHATLEGDRFDGEEFAPQGASRTMDAVTAEGFLHTPTTTPAPPDPAPVGGPDQDVGVGSRPGEVAHRPKGGVPFGRAWSVGRAQSTAVAVMPARAVVAVATRSRAATARVKACVAGGPWDTSSRAMTTVYSSAGVRPSSAGGLVARGARNAVVGVERTLVTGPGLEWPPRVSQARYSRSSRV